MWPFSGSGKERRVPSERISQMYAKGYSDPEIVRTLREEGYSPSEVDAAIRQTVSQAASGHAKPPAHEAPPSQEMRDPRLGMPPLPGEPGFEPHSATPLPEQQPETPPAKAPLAPSGNTPPAPKSREPIPALSEPVVMEEPPQAPQAAPIAPPANELKERLSGLEEAVKKLQEDMSLVSSPDQQLEQRQDKAIQELSARLSALENSVKASLSPLMENMRILSETVQALRKNIGK